MLDEEDEMATKAMHVASDGGRALRALGTTVRIMATVHDTGGAYEAIVVEADRGGDGVPHRHPWEELYLVLDGTMDVTIGARTHRAAPGDLVTIPARALHTFAVTSDAARFLHLSIGPGASAMFEDFAAVVPEAPGLEDLSAIFQVNERHGIELLLPPEVLALHRELVDA
jgi:quercetin dioxygenase-like cupin family protein